MKEEKDDSIDKLFSEGLSDPGSNASYRDEDWDKLEVMLDNKKPAGLVRNFIILMSAVAAMLLLIIGWAYLKPRQANDVTPRMVKAAQHPKKDSGKYGPPVQQMADLKSNTLSATDSSTTGATHVSRRSKSFFTLSAVPGGRSTTGKNHTLVKLQPVISTSPDTLSTTKAAGRTAVTIKQVDTTSAAIAINNMAVNTKPADTISKPDKHELVSVMDDVKPRKQQKKQAVGYIPRFALSFVASPDINSVKGFSNTKVGTNAGMLLTVGLSKKWSLTTGAIYADKPYMTSFSNYATAYQFGTNPASVTASCIVLDIPLNLGYQIYNKGANKFSIGTGLSSYFMLRENYTFNYTNPYPDGPASYNIRNSNKHILGVLNLNVTYQREISSKFGVGVQPYFKLPLTGIGYGQVNLKSAGVAVGVTWNLSTGTKP
jgi:cytoskeletal protein RodZ